MVTFGKFWRVVLEYFVNRLVTSRSFQSHLFYNMKFHNFIKIVHPFIKLFKQFIRPNLIKSKQGTIFDQITFHWSLSIHSFYLLSSREDFCNRNRTKALSCQETETSLSNFLKFLIRRRRTLVPHIRPFGLNSSLKWSMADQNFKQFDACS